MLATNIDADIGRALLAIARSAIGKKLDLCDLALPDHEALAAPGATFVTLRRDAELRGCIGSLDAVRPLRTDVHENAIASAFRDPRFEPLAAWEYATISVEVSLIGTCERIAFTSEDDVLARLRPGSDGVILEHGFHRATFLPQVWRDFDDSRGFLAALKRKAGLPEAFWSPRMSISLYQVNKWSEHDFPLTETMR